MSHCEYQDFQSEENRTIATKRTSQQVNHCRQRSHIDQVTGSQRILCKQIKYRQENMMTEALTKQPTLAELRVAARVLLEEDPSLTAARYAAPNAGSQNSFG